MRIDTEAGEGELAHIGAADGDHAGIPQQSDDGRIPLGRRIPCQDARTRRRRHTFDVEKIFPGDRNTVQQSERAPLPQPFGRRARFLYRPFFKQCGENGLVGVIRDGVKDGLGHIDRIGCAALNEDGKLGDRHGAEGYAHGTIQTNFPSGLARIVSMSQSFTIFCVH